MVKCNLELNAQQTELVIKALELYSRIGTGQLSALMSHPAMDTLEPDAHFDADKALFEVKRIVFPELKEAGDAMSLRNEKVGMESKNAYDIMQAMKHELAMADKKGEHSVWRFEPRIAGNQPFPLCRLT